ncbi:hypothetical protein BY458DRAFT_508558 [Sporodiniella umbellata]|nr:hypothetical protein BY458DRAFT_508558 [Sporodiniella umbellata]
MNFDDSNLFDPNQSFEAILYQHLQPELQRRDNEILTENLEYITKDYTYLMDNAFLPIDQEIVVEFSNFSELQATLQRMENMDPQLYHMQDHTIDSEYRSAEEDLLLLASTTYTIPPSIHNNIESLGFIDAIMSQAIQHWCCIGFKVVPISVELIKDWRRAPRAIVYCIASISLVSLINRNVNSQSSFAKQASIAFYEKARKNMDDVFLDDMQPQIIQTYFCLSYTSNLLRLYDQQRTWGGLASISLQHLAKTRIHQIDPLSLGCWLRWYYVDAWMCLTLNRDCLLPHDVPWLKPDKIYSLSISQLESDQAHQLYGFACLTNYMRRYIRLLHSGKIFLGGLYKTPSKHYYEITNELTKWYDQLPLYTISSSRLHLHICYHSMRLIILYQFLRPYQPPPSDILIDCLLTNLELLQALQHMKETGCDQSTYHHMFFAINNTAKRILRYNIKPLNQFAEESLRINLSFLKTTQAYVHDVFKMKFYAEKIEEQFSRLGISETKEVELSASKFLVFKRDATTKIKRVNKKRKEKKKED